MKKTYHGSCHCGAVRFEVDVDLAAETSRCNCAMCTKVRLWKTVVAPADVRVLRGEDALAEYRFGSRKIQHVFCRTCGVNLFGQGYVEAIGGEYVSVYVAALDDLDPSDLVEAPIQYMDGRHDNWWNAPAETRHL